MKIVLGDSETLRNCRQILFNEFRVIAKEKNAEGWAIVYEHAAIAIEHAAARRNDGNRTDAILFGHLAILITVDDLQLPEAKQQQADHAYDDVGDDCEPRLRQPIVITEPVRHKNPVREAISSLWQGRICAELRLTPCGEVFLNLASAEERRNPSAGTGFRVVNGRKVAMRKEQD